MEVTQMENRLNSRFGDGSVVLDVLGFSSTGQDLTYSSDYIFATPNLIDSPQGLWSISFLMVSKETRYLHTNKMGLNGNKREEQLSHGVWQQSGTILGRWTDYCVHGPKTQGVVDFVCRFRCTQVVFGRGVKIPSERRNHILLLEKTLKFFI